MEGNKKIINSVVGSYPDSDSRHFLFGEAILRNRLEEGWIVKMCNQLSYKEDGKSIALEYILEKEIDIKDA